MPDPLSHLQKVQQQIDDARREFAAAAAAQLEQIRIKYLGGQGLVKAAKKLIGQAEPTERPAIGKLASEFEAACKDAFDTAKARLTEAGAAMGLSGAKATGPIRDWTLYPEYAPGGSLHPITKMIHLMTDALGKLGFEVAVGPEVETAFNNFEALNLPIWHPARDAQDTFYLHREGKNLTGEPLLLRTHTSPVQVRHMLANPPPARIITLGRCYRADPIDATHHSTFHQIEGLYVDKNVSMADLKGVLSELCKAAFGSETRTRFRPSFFPFVEPGAEVDAEIVNRRGERRWIELGGCGMVHPQVLRNVNIDPEIYSGFAFGMGIERFLILRHQDNEQLDLRHFLESDVRVLRQFA